ncbi:MAG: hypothetical protein NZ957_05250 [Thaumarchaeota archaeon]|nr:hypothetical protein [Candidatus Calditenuaceae archaeon]
MSLNDKLIRTFFAKPHVASVRHFEGLTIVDVRDALSKFMNTQEIRCELAIEEYEGREVLNALVPLEEGITCWVRAEDLKELGCLVEVKIYHELEMSALADERLTNLMVLLERTLRRSSRDQRNE